MGHPPADHNGYPRQPYHPCRSAHRSRWRESIDLDAGGPHHFRPAVHVGAEQGGQHLGTAADRLQRLVAQLLVHFRQRQGTVCFKVEAGKDARVDGGRNPSPRRRRDALDWLA